MVKYDYDSISSKFYISINYDMQLVIVKEK